MSNDAFVIAAIGLVLAAWGGVTAKDFTDNAWRRDCDALGRTVSRGDVYECRKIKQDASAARS